MKLEIFATPKLRVTRAWYLKTSPTHSLIVADFGSKRVKYTTAGLSLDRREFWFEDCVRPNAQVVIRLIAETDLEKEFLNSSTDVCETTKHGAIISIFPKNFLDPNNKLRLRATGKYRPFNRRYVND